MMRVLVCGGRDFTDTERVYGVLDKLHKNNVIDAVIEGDSRGPDRMAGFWARKNRIQDIKFPAMWKKYGRRAGPMRNQEMLDHGKPDLVIAFPGGGGTADMVRRARDAGVEVIEA